MHEADKPVTGAAHVTVTLHPDHVATLLRVLADPETVISDQERHQITDALEAVT